MKIYCTNTPHGLMPNTDMDYEKKLKLKLGQVYRVEIKQPRNYEFHKKYFALLNLVWENLPDHLSEGFRRFDNFRETVQMQAGWYEMYVNHKGVQMFKPKSISFGSMSAEEFEELYSNVIDIILRDYIPGMDREELEMQVITGFA